MLAEAIVLIPRSANKGTEIQMKVLPLVLCKDCKHYRKNTRYPDTNLIMNYCTINVITGKDDDWFCADGERKKGR